MNPQNQILTSSISRRDFLSNSGKLATSGALAGVALPMVHGQSSDVTKLALVGCGGRGTGAASNGNGNSFIYMAFAAEPLVGSNNIPAVAR